MEVHVEGLGGLFPAGGPCRLGPQELLQPVLGVLQGKQTAGDPRGQDGLEGRGGVDAAGEDVVEAQDTCAAQVERGRGLERGYIVANLVTSF